jgi:predicted TIM-barrel fold metal-dependent hydrolase
MTDLPRTDEDLPAFLADLGIPGIWDVHVHCMPDRIQEAVWRHFDELDAQGQSWSIPYRTSQEERLARLAEMGVLHHTALAYAHRPGVARWLNEYTLGLGASHERVVPTFTIYPEPDTAAYVEEALTAGGRCVKVHLQVGKFDPCDPQLDEAWAAIEGAAVPVIIHAGAVADGSGGEEWCGTGPVRRLLEQHPELHIVVAHLGMPEEAAFFDLADEVPSLRFDTAMALIPSSIQEPGSWLADRLAGFEDRVLFGSDFPTVPAPVVEQVRAAADLGLGAGWLRRVLWDNAAALFGP